MKRQKAADPVDVPRALAHELGPLAREALGVLGFRRRHLHHAAHAAVAAEVGPEHEGWPRHRGGRSWPFGHGGSRETRRVEDMRLDVVLPKEAREPEAVVARLEADHGWYSRPASTLARASMRRSRARSAGASPPVTVWSATLRGLGAAPHEPAGATQLQRDVAARLGRDHRRHGWISLAYPAEAGLASPQKAHPHRIYNTIHPHSGLRMRSPREFIAAQSATTPLVRFDGGNSRRQIEQPRAGSLDAARMLGRRTDTEPLRRRAARRARRDRRYDPLPKNNRQRLRHACRPLPTDSLNQIRSASGKRLDSVRSRGALEPIHAAQRRFRELPDPLACPRRRQSQAGVHRLRQAPATARASDPGPQRSHGCSMSPRARASTANAAARVATVLPAAAPSSMVPGAPQAS